MMRKREQLSLLAIVTTCVLFASGSAVAESPLDLVLISTANKPGSTPMEWTPWPKDPQVRGLTARSRPGKSAQDAD